jgi:hypothetical protein
MAIKKQFLVSGGRFRRPLAAVKFQAFTSGVPEYPAIPG